MKRRLLKFAFAALTIGLLGSCAKINERIDGLDKRVYDLENGKIASIENQIASINTSIADLVTIRSNIQDLISKTQAQGGDITGLKAADVSLGQRIDELKSYIDGELTGYAKIDWVKATFATLEQHEWTCDTIAGIDARIGALDTRLSQSISGLESSLKQWVNVQLDAYYTAAQMDAKIGTLLAQIQGMGSSANARIDSLAAELTATKSSVDTAKANIRSEYRSVIASAIETSEGKLTQALKDSITAVNGKITVLTGRIDALETTVAALNGDVDALKAMIQSVSITPAYSDGSVEAVGGILTLKCIVSPAKAISGMASLKDSLLIYADSVKVKTKATTPAYMTIKVSEASVLDAAQGAITLKANISEYLPKGEDKALTVAVNIKNGISHFTTEFVPVTVAAANPIVEYVEIAAKYNGSTVSTLRWYRQNLAITGSGKKAWTDDSGSPVKVPGTGEDVVVGDYFQWGTFAGFYGSGADSDKGLLPYSSFTNTGCGDGSNAFTFESGKQFNEANAPYYSGSAYTKYNATDGKTTLEASDDVASIILGGTWRMPTKDEIKAMKEATYWAWDATDKGYYVYAPNPATDAGKVNNGTGTYNKADALLFFPATGYGDGTPMSNAGTYGYYRSSTLCSGNTGCAYRQFFNDTNVYTDNYTHRRCGISVRPVQDPAATYVAVTNVSPNETSKNITVGGNLQLKATVIPDDATQQGVYWTSSAPTVATVDATGKVTAVAAGTATITATTVDGSKTASCTVTVSAPQVTVTFDLNGISGTAPTPQTIEKGGKVTKPTDPTDQVHTFAGWYKTKDATTGALSDPWDFDNDTVTADMTLYAKWTRTMKDLLGNDFPQPTGTEIVAPTNAWTNENGYKAYIYNSAKFFKLDPGNGNGIACLTSNQFTRIGDGKYVFKYVNGSNNYGVFTLNLNIEDSTLVSIEYEGTDTNYSALTGTYTAPTPTTTGTAKATIGGSQVDVNWVQLWENGPKFAEVNVGVTDGKAESYGLLYAWVNNIASSQWGENWRMPTQTDLQELLSNCTVEWTQVNSVNGRKFTGKGAYASNSVFLPAAGCYYSGKANYQGSRGLYWSSTPSGDYPYGLYFDSGEQLVLNYHRDNGYSVRAVLAE